MKKAKGGIVILRVLCWLRQEYIPRFENYVMWFPGGGNMLTVGLIHDIFNCGIIDQYYTMEKTGGSEHV